MELASQNKKTVEKYMDGFRSGNHELILSCLADEVVWDMPGYFHHQGKNAFDQEIANEAFEGLPAIQVVRMIEEDNIVVAEGAVQCKIRNGGMLDALFCDVFHLENGLIKKLTTYQVSRKRKRI